MLSLQQVGSHEWQFVYPEQYEELMEEFHQGVELLEGGRLNKAERIFRQTLAQMPDHLDALHHLALVLDEEGRKAAALTVWEEAVRIGRAAFPAGFNPGRDRLEWGWLENRPFLRCLQGLALAYREAGDTERALGLYRDLLALNPGDNQGVRGVMAEALFELSRPAEVLALCERYPGDIMPELTYGRALALFTLGRRREADRALREAVAGSPLVTAELLKARHRRPRSRFPGTVTVGGPDEAFDYWEHHGKFWGATPGALGWLRGIVDVRTPRRVAQAGVRPSAIMRDTMERSASGKEGLSLAKTIRARFHDGKFEPLEAVDLPEGREVTLTIVEAPSTPDFAAFSRAAGAWKGTLDAEGLIRDIYADRLLATRPEPRL